ncbi:hypothetical protein SERLADRAFT_412873 [Serpula lacrymans var. lacrymans S7.9]|uniref:SET domain-containing protein n=1 Tax=Serpula lacrymans var. lacrymans (strain S7.9) TaxID=578457 RepID=F8NJ44_SERL9|nr:uncharacterized protein SERLADRAFT_412873 [Serpula lacrymans var. lacrymans S7.9]EGO29325.1 hypothetical protein SERLADRAFT_412873 [Serpula lacrymans var. lacrymans S7.9]
MSLVPPMSTSGQTEPNSDTTTLVPDRDLIHRVFAQVWTEFYKWEQQYSRDRVQNLSRSDHYHTSPSAPAIVKLSERLSNVSMTQDVEMQLEMDRARETMQFERFYEDGSSSISPITLHVIHAPEVQPHSSYEACAPIQRSVFHGDDSDAMPFMPFADEPEFDAHDYAQFYGSFAWEQDYDPDLEIIVLEAAHRLRNLHDISFQRIDESVLLPFTLLSKDGRTGLLEMSRSRDLLKWPGFTATHHSLQAASEPAAHDLRTRLKGAISLFCPNLSCVQPWCSVHVEPYPIPNPKEPDPKLTRKGFIKVAGKPCGDDCFVNNQDSPPDILWTETDLETFKVIFEVTPDTMPCDLAVLCRKPCREVFHQRNVILQSPAEPVPDSAKRKLRPRALEFSGIDANKFTPNKPCHHDGPCDSLSRCNCFLNKAHCQRNCHCTLKCGRRWRGCRCATSKAHGSCIQRGHSKGLDVKEEYVGEIIYEATTESRQDVAKYRGRNYLFGLNDTLSLDSTYVGNAARFINHCADTSGSLSNCRACVRLVNDEHRIGIYAMQDIKAGDEILINYGPSFFLDNNGNKSVMLSQQ